MQRVLLIGIYLILIISILYLRTSAQIFDEGFYYCPQNVEIKSGPTWRNITVGQSTLFDIEQLFGIRFTNVITFQPERVYRNRFYVRLLDERAYKEELPTYVEVCLIEGKIATIHLAPDADSGTLSGPLSEWVQLYGLPKYVTWDATGNNLRWRTVVWPDKGIILHVDVSPTINDPTIALVTSVTFAPFATSDNFLSKWPYSNLPTESLPLTTEGFPTEQNPFDFNALIEHSDE